MNGLSIKQPSLPGRPIEWRVFSCVLTLIVVLLLAATATGQQGPRQPGYQSGNSGLTVRLPGQRGRYVPHGQMMVDAGPRLSNSSWTYVPPSPPRKFQVQDIVFIVVNETAQSTAEADVQRRKNSIYNAVLEDWVMLRGLFTLKPAPQSNGDPTVAGQLNQTLRSEADTEIRESIQMKVSARIADIQPNGHLVLEAHKRIRVNNEVFEVSLSGVVDPEDVAADRSVQSERIVNLMLERRNRGHVRDATKRGWLVRWVDTFDPF